MLNEPSALHPVEQLAEEFVQRYRRGERPAISEYQERFPELAAEISQLFRALVLMEEGGRSGSTAETRSRLPEQAAPVRLGEYRILREVGRGGMGVVYEAEQESLGRHVALKVLPRDLCLDPVRLERFRREARTAARLHHTNIVPVFGVGEQDGTLFYAMQFINGQGLDQVLEEIKRLRAASPAKDGRRPATSVAELLWQGPSDPRPAPTADGEPSGTRLTVVQQRASTLVESNRHYYQSVARIGLQVAEALSYAHQQHVLHRDIKLSNLLLDTHGAVWVTDFGLASADDQEPLTRTGDVVGTLSYLAPERLSGLSGPRSDVYSLGVTLYELLTLQSAFADADRGRLVRRILQEEPPWPRKLDPLIPAELETVVHKAIAKAPRDRYATAEAMAEDLRRFLTDRPIQARRTSPAERLWRWCRRNPLPASLAATAFVFLAVGLLVALGLWRRAEQHAQAAHEQSLRADANFQTAYATVGEMLTRLGEVDLKDVPQAEPVRRKLLQAAVEFYQKFIQDNGDGPVLRAELAHAHDRLAGIHEDLGNLAEAEASWRNAANLYQDLADADPDSPRYRVEVAHCQESLGSLLTNLGRMAEAETAFRSARDILSATLVGAGGESDRALALGRIHINYALLLSRSGRGTEAEAELRTGSTVLENEIEKDADAARAKRMLATLLNNLAVQYSAQGRRDEEGAAYERAMQLQREFVERNPDKVGGRRELARTYNNYATWLGSKKRSAEAESHFHQAILLLARLTADFPNLPEIQHEYAMARSNFGRFLLEGFNRPADAEQEYRQAATLHEALVARMPAVPDYRSRLGMDLVGLARALQRQKNDLPEASRCCERAIQAQKAAWAAEPTNVSYRNHLIEHYDRALMILLERKLPAQVAALAEQYAVDFQGQGGGTYRAACFFAENLRLVTKDPALTEAYTAKALHYLRSSLQFGFRDKTALERDGSFRSLKQHPEFQQLLRDLATSNPPKSKPQP